MANKHKKCLVSMVFTHAGEKNPCNNQTFPVFKLLKAKKGNDTQCW